MQGLNLILLMVVLFKIDLVLGISSSKNLFNILLFLARLLA